MAVRYLNATGTQSLINTIKSLLAQKSDVSTTTYIQQQLDTISASIPTRTSQLANDSNFLTNTEVENTYYTKAAAQTLSTIVTSNQAAIALLNADSETEGSVDYKIAQAIGGGIESISQSEIEELF